MYGRLFLYFILLSTCYGAHGQASYTSLKFFGLSLHPFGDENAHLMPLNPDQKGYVVLNMGGVLAHEIRLGESRYSVKVLQALYADCAAQTGGFSHIGFRAVIWSNSKQEFTGGLGPTFIFRRNWHRLPSYTPSEFFNGQAGDPWQYRMLWYGGELEYHYFLSENWAFSTTFIPGFPNIMSLSAGIRFKHR